MLCPQLATASLPGEPGASRDVVETTGSARDRYGGESVFALRLGHYPPNAHGQADMRRGIPKPVLLIVFASASATAHARGWVIDDEMRFPAGNPPLGGDLLHRSRPYEKGEDRLHVGLSANANSLYDHDPQRGGRHHLGTQGGVGFILSVGQMVADKVELGVKLDFSALSEPGWVDDSALYLPGSVTNGRANIGVYARRYFPFELGSECEYAPYVAYQTGCVLESLASPGAFLANYGGAIGIERRLGSGNAVGLEFGLLRTLLEDRSLELRWHCMITYSTSYF